MRLENCSDVKVNKHLYPSQDCSFNKISYTLKIRDHLVLFIEKFKLLKFKRWKFSSYRNFTFFPRIKIRMTVD